MKSQSKKSLRKAEPKILMGKKEITGNKSKEDGTNRIVTMKGDIIRVTKVSH